MAKPKTGLMAIIAGPKAANDNAGESDEAEASPLRRALQDLSSAMKSGDWGAAETAFRDAKAACEDDYEDEAEGAEMEN